MRWKKILLLTPAVVLLLLVAFYFLLDAWLESAGGKRALERALSERSGMPVRLNGAFDIMLLPSIGVNGTDLQVLDPLRGHVLVQGGYYEVALDIGPLLKEQLVVRQLTIEELQIEPETDGFRIEQLSLSGYAENQPTQIRAELGEFGRVDGVFTWFPARLALDLDLGWLSREGVKGHGAAKVAWAGAHFKLSDLDVELAGQSVRGEGCVVIGSPPTVNLALQSDSMNIDEVLESLPGGQGELELDGFELPFELNLIFKTAELTSGGTRARDVTLELGGPPVCSA